jgi:hypothetical protein
MITIKRLGGWSPASTPPPYYRPDAIQVGTDGRGAVVWLDPVPHRRHPGVGAGGGLKVTPGRPKLMMDPLDRSTWQRPYRFT